MNQAKPKRRKGLVNKMRKHESDEFLARALTGGSYLMTNSGTLDGVRKEIDASNDRAVKKGYKSSRWIITHREYYTWTDDNGQFLRSEILETAIEVYPK